MKADNKKLLIGFLIGVIITSGVLGYLGYQKWLSTEKSAEETAKNQKEALDLCEKSTEPESCKIRVKAIINNNPELCKKAKNTKGCYYWVATLAGNPGGCEAFDQTQEHDKRNSCYINAAKTQDSLEPCEEVVTPRLCYREMASYRGDPELCEKVNEQGVCYYAAAIEAKDKELCEKGWWENRCKAIISGNSELCEKAADPKECYLKVARETNSPSLCKKTNQEETCYFRTAILNQNEALCKKTEEPGVCYTKVAMRSADEKLCPKSNKPGDCYFWVAQFLVESPDYYLYR